MNNEVKVKVDISQVKQMIADFLDPGAVLLPKSAVENLYKVLDSARTKESVYSMLVECGGIMSTGEAES